LLASDYFFINQLAPANHKKGTPMMINKRLINTVKESKRYIAGNVICQWISLVANITMMAAIAVMLLNLYLGTDSHIGATALIALIAVILRCFCTTAASG
jgi:hypothetical protein